jgi:hypothetical protein
MDDVATAADVDATTVPFFFLLFSTSIFLLSMVLLVNRTRPSSKFSICIGMFINASNPSAGVCLPSNIRAMPNKMGYFKSSRYPLISFSINRTTAYAVSTPSATSVVDSNISCIVSP